MKKLAALTLFVLLTVSCRGGVVPPVTPQSASRSTQNFVTNVAEPACTMRRVPLHVSPRTLSLSLSSSGEYGKFTVCTEHATTYRLTASPAGIVSVPATVSPTIDPANGIGKAVVPVRAKHPGEAVITLRDPSGHRETVAVAVALGRLYVAERQQSGDVKVYNALNLAQLPTTIGPLEGAEGIAVATDTTAGKLYVSEDFTGEVKVYDTAGACPFQLVATISGFNSPSGLAIDPVAQMLYVTEFGDVKVFSTANGRYGLVTVLGAAAGIDVPGGLAVDPIAQKLYIAQGSNDVNIYNTANLNQPPSTISDVSQPGGIAIDHTAGRVYVTENGAGDVRVYDEITNQFLSTIATGLVQPFGDADDPVAGKLYVVEFGAGDVKIFNTQNPAQTPQTIGGLSDPWAIAVGP